MGDTLLFPHLPHVGACQGKPRFIHANPDEHRHFPHADEIQPALREEARSLWRGRSLVAPERSGYGNGHFIQRLQRAFDLEPALKPQPYLSIPGRKVQNSVVLHFECCTHWNWQRQHLHPRARMLYEEGRSVVQEFINNHPELEFYQLGKQPVTLSRVRNMPDNTLEDTIKFCLQPASSWASSQAP